MHRLVRGGAALFCAHTNADSADPGVSDALAEALGLTVTGPLEPNAGRAHRHRPDRASCPRPSRSRRSSQRVAAALPRDRRRRARAGDLDRPIRTVAVSGGAGDAYLDAATRAGVDAFVTADLRHHPASEHLAAAGAPALVDVAHWASEWPWCEQAAAILRDVLGGNVDITVSTRRTDPGPSRRP